MMLYDAKVLVCSCPGCGCTCYAIVPNEREKYPSWFQHTQVPICNLELELDFHVWTMICRLVDKDAHETIIEQWVKRLVKLRS